MDYRASHPTRAHIHLAHLAHNLRLLQSRVGARPMWPAIKANAYGHGAEIVARELVRLGYDRLCVAHVPEAIELIEAGVEATFLVLSASLPDAAEHCVAHALEPAVCSVETLEALARAAARQGRTVTVHVKVDTGMGRVGLRPDQVSGFLERCHALAGVRVGGVMSHFARADEAEKSSAREQIARFGEVRDATGGQRVPCFHMANSAAILELPEAHLDAVRPGISIYGLSPSPAMTSAAVAALRPVLELKTRITFLKEVPAGTGLSYGHAYHTARRSLVATIPVGYGDGVTRRLSDRLEVLVGGLRCPQVGRITMDQSLVDVTELRGRVALGDEVVLIGRQGDQVLTADAIAARLDTINYEVVTAIAARVPRVAV